jgi:hypothetical protein
MADQICIDDHCVREAEEDGDEDLDVVDGDDEEEIAKCGEAPEGMSCEPGCAECVDRARSRTCSEDGMILSTRFCDEGDFCNSRSGLCEGIICSPGEVSCSEDELTQLECRGDGSGWVETKCAASETCREGACINLVCQPDDETNLYIFNSRSVISSSDRFCQTVANIGSASWIEQPGRGSVAAFTGAQTRMMLDSESGSFYARMSVGADVYLETGGGSEYEVIIQKGDPATYRLAIENAKAVLRISIGGKERKLESDDLERSRWYSIVGTFDGMEIHLYVDGVLQGEPAIFDRIMTIDPNSSRISVGARTTASGLIAEELKGYIDNLFLSGRAIREGEAGYLSAQTSPCAEQEMETPPDCSGLCDRTILAVPINQTWTQTELQPKSGEAVFISPGGCPHPSSTSFCITAEGLGGQSCESCPAIDEPRYSLLARVGSIGTPEFVGAGGAFVSVIGDTLYLGYNDRLLEQNRGGFSVVLEQGYCENSRCPSDMVSIPGKSACMDRYEASCPTASENGSTCSSGTDDIAMSVPGIIPWTNISPQAANLACAKIGKRLCREEEWNTGCRGPEDFSYPYGDSRLNYTCNDFYFSPPAPFTTLVPTGLLIECVNATGALDLSGNAGEWVEKTEGSGFKAMAGKGQTADQFSSCHDSLEMNGEDMLTGFRCCKDLN